MSVHGEFELYRDNTAQAMREAELGDRASEAEAIARARSDPLEDRARRVLDGPLGQREALGEGFPRVREALDGLLSISRIILGR